MIRINLTFHKNFYAMQILSKNLCSAKTKTNFALLVNVSNSLKSSKSISIVSLSHFENAISNYKKEVEPVKIRNAITIFPHIVAAATIQGRKLYEEIRYLKSPNTQKLSMSFCHAGKLLLAHFNWFKISVHTFPPLWVWAKIKTKLSMSTG
jgi:hypothetical protein